MIVIEKHAPSDQFSKLGSHHWSVARLVSLSKDLEVMDIPLKHFNIWHNYKEMTLREMAGHVKSANEADLSFPIILDEDGDIMDGRHRLIKALVEGKETIKAVRFDKNPTPCRVASEPE